MNAPLSAPPRPALLALGLLALVALAHGTSLANGFVYDDHWTLLGNPVVRSPGQIWSLWGPALVRADVPDAGRPLMLASEMLDWSLWGSAPRGYHLQSLLWHAGVVLLLFRLLAGLGATAWLAAGAAGLFAVHPLGVEAVAVINYREDLLVAFFTLAALVAIRGARRAPTRAGTLALTAAAVAATMAAGFAKENGVLVPIFLVLLDVFVGPGVALRRRARDYLALATAAAVPLAWRWLLLGSPLLVSHTAEIPHGHLDRAATIPLAALGFVQGLGQFLLPLRLSPEYGEPAGGAVMALGWVCLALVVLTVGAALAVHRPPSWLGLGFTFAVVAYLPHAGLVPLTNLRADRYFYLPALGLALATAAAAAWAAARLPGGSSPAGVRARIAAGVLVAALLAGHSARQTRIWRSERTVFAAAVAGAPESSRAWLGLASAELNAGNTMAALAAVEHVLQAAPDAQGHANARELRGLVAMRQGDHARARQELLAALATAVPARRARVLNNLGYVELALGRREEARGRFAEARRLAPWFDRPWLNEARSQLDAGDEAAAAATLEQLVTRIPQSIDGWKQLGSLRERQARRGEARQAWLRAAAIDRRDSEVARALARLE